MKNLHFFSSILVFTLLTQIVIGQSTSRLYMPILPAGDTIFEVNISNIDILKVDKSKTPNQINMQKCVFPCFKHVIARNNTTNSEFRSSTIKKNKLLSFSQRDPFFSNTKSTIVFNKSIKVKSSLNRQSSKAQVSEKASIQYDSSMLPFDFQNWLDSLSFQKMHIDLVVTISQVSEGIKNILWENQDYTLNQLNETQVFKIAQIKAWDGMSWTEIGSIIPIELKRKYLQTKTINWSFFKQENYPFYRMIFLFDNAKGIKQAWFRQDRFPYTVKECKIAEQQFYLFPNPTYGNVYISNEGYPYGHYTLEIKNIIGQVILESKFQIDNGQSEMLDLNVLKKGTYIYTIINSSGEHLVTKRLIIMDI